MYNINPLISTLLEFFLSLKNFDACITVFCVIVIILGPGIC